MLAPPRLSSAGTHTFDILVLLPYVIHSRRGGRNFSVRFCYPVLEE